MKPHEEWLFKAEQDLKSAQLLYNSAENLLDIAVYHCQQCAEKALKAYLTYREQDIDKTHNLVLLVERCQAIDQDFGDLVDPAIYLRPYATLYRYPAGDSLPQKIEVKTGLEKARVILQFVNQKTDQT